MPQLCPVSDDVTETNVYNNPPVLTKKPEPEICVEGNAEKVELKSEENAETAAPEATGNEEKPENFRSSCEEMTDNNEGGENVSNLLCHIIRTYFQRFDTKEFFHSISENGETEMQMSAIFAPSIFELANKLFNF